MGLDMDLYAVVPSEMIPNGIRKSVAKTIETLVYGELAGRSEFVPVKVASWHKWQPILGWFVRNTAVGELVRPNLPVSGSRLVSRKEVEKLCELCERILSEHKAKKDIPSEAFDELPDCMGDYRSEHLYDAFYFRSVRYTLRAIRKSLERLGNSGDHVWFCFEWSC